MDKAYPFYNVTVFYPQARTSSEFRLNGWSIPAEELEYIPDHWLSYPEPAESLHFMLGILYIFLMFVALIGNGLVIWIFSSSKALRSPSNLFVVNLAIFDFIMFIKIPIFIYNSFSRGYAAGHVACQIFAAIGSISGIGAGMNNAFIGYDRYNVITRPLEGKLSMQKAVLIVVFIWIYTIPWTAMPLIEVWGRFVPGMDLIDDPNGNLTFFYPEARTASEVRLIGWNIPPHELRHVPDHWLSYPEPPASMHLLLGLIYVFFTVVSLVGNGLVIWIFSSAKTLRTPSNFFVINLAVCDFFMMVKTPVFIYNSFLQGYALGHLGCQVFSTIGALTGIGASMTNAYIAYDRYNVITRPLEGKLTKTKALVMLVFLWIYVTPWAFLPLAEVWGRFVPGNFGCQVFGTIGSFSGIASGMTNAFIGYDRYNVIARPMEGKLTFKKGVAIVIIIWTYTIPWVLMPLFQVWGRYVPEGYLTSCTFDYMTDNFDTRLFVGCIFFCSYCIPMSMIIYYYSQIVSHVFAHEKTLREQAKKMNVESLRSNTGQNKESAEIRIAKAAITICFLFVAAWTPYGVMSLIGAFGDKNLLTPGVTMIPACACKLVACIDPYVYAISHPRYRMELQKRLPWLAIDEKEEKETQSQSTTSENQTTAA